MLDFTGRVIIITGAARGIGRAHAELLAARGASVVLADSGGNTDGQGMDATPGEEVAHAIGARGDTALAITADVTREGDVQRIVDGTLARFGRIDGLVNNAGIIRMGSFAETPIATYRAHMDVHFMGTVMMCQAAWPHLIQSGTGRIVNTLSGAITAARDMAHYAATQGALYAFTRNLALEGADAGVLVNAVSPAADTRMIEVPGMAEALPPGSLDHLRAHMAPEWIAPVAAWLLHPDCHLNGEVLSAGGGSVSRMVMMDTAGITAADLSPETVAARINAIMDMAGARVAPLSTGHPSVEIG